MKRTYNDVALETICYTIGGLQKIKVIDYDNTYELWERKNGKVVAEGLLKDIRHGNHYRMFRSKVWATDIEDNTIIFSIHTKYEEY